MVGRLGRGVCVGGGGVINKGRKKIRVWGKQQKNSCTILIRFYLNTSTEKTGQGILSFSYFHVVCLIELFNHLAYSFIYLFTIQQQLGSIYDCEKKDVREK